MNNMAQRYLPEVVDLIDNWVRYFRTVPHKGHCRSIEHRYRAPSVSAENQASNVVVMADMHSALLVERTICDPAFPGKHRALIKAEFVQRIDPRKTCVALGMRYGSNGGQYDIEVYRACLMLQNRLDKKTRSAYKVNHKFHSPSEIEQLDAFSTLSGVEARPKEARTR